MSVVSPRFFKRVGNRSEAHLQPMFVDVGGAADSGFRAVAVGLIDNLSSRPRGHAELLNPLLNRYFLYFPEHRETTPCLVTPLERLEGLTHRLSMGELIQMLAYTLRQMAVDEMCSQPSRYRAAFVERYSRITPAVMRESTTWLHECSLSALAEALSLPMVIYLGRETMLRARISHHHQEPLRFLPVVLQRVDLKFSPRVSMGGRFASLKHHPVREFHRVASLTLDPSLTEIQMEISTFDAQLKQTFLAVQHRLTTMVALNELSSDDLLAMVVNGLSKPRPGRVAALELGSASFFDELLPEAMAVRQVDVFIHALARAITLEQMKEDDVFEHLEEAHEEAARKRI